LGSFHLVASQRGARGYLLTPVKVLSCTDMRISIDTAPLCGLAIHCGCLLPESPYQWAVLGACEVPGGIGDSL